MVHSSWRALKWFQGYSSQFGHALREAVGEGGFAGDALTDLSQYEFCRLSRYRQTNGCQTQPIGHGPVDRSLPARQGVLRSLSPTHPLLAWGRDASAFISGHELTDHPSGHSPRLRDFSSETR